MPSSSAILLGNMVGRMKACVLVEAVAVVLVK